MKRRWIFRRLSRVIPIVIAVVAAIGLIFMGLWNSLVPELFDGPSISFWQALGLLLMARILVGGPGPGRFGGRFGGDRWRRRRFKERMESMSPEMRERFRQRWGERCGPWDEESADRSTEASA